MFRHGKLVVYNIYGQKVALKIVTKPNCFGYIEVINDEVGQRCLEIIYSAAMALHDVRYVDRFVDKPRRKEEWRIIHQDCLFCLGTQAAVADLNSVPDWNLDRLFTECERFKAPLRRQKLALLPPPDPNATTVAKLPDDETTILELRRELLSHKIASSMYVASLKSEIKLQKEKVSTLRSNCWMVKKDLEEATRKIRRFHLIIKALPDEVYNIAHEVEMRLERKLDELLV